MYSETVYGALVSKVCFEVFIDVFSPYIRVEDFDHSVQVIVDKRLILNVGHKCLALCSEKEKMCESGKIVSECDKVMLSPFGRFR